MNDLEIAKSNSAISQLSVKRIYADVELESLLRLAPVIDRVAVDYICWVFKGGLATRRDCKIVFCQQDLPLVKMLVGAENPEKNEAKADAKLRPNRYHALI